MARLRQHCGFCVIGNKSLILKDKNLSTQLGVVGYFIDRVVQLVIPKPEERGSLLWPYKCSQLIVVHLRLAVTSILHSFTMRKGVSNDCGRIKADLKKDCWKISNLFCSREPCFEKHNSRE